MMYPKMYSYSHVIRRLGEMLSAVGFVRLTTKLTCRYAAQRTNGQARCLDRASQLLGYSACINYLFPIIENNSLAINR